MLMQGTCPHVGAAKTRVVATTTSERRHGVLEQRYPDARELTPGPRFQAPPTPSLPGEAVA